MLNRGDNEKFDDEARKLFARLGLSADGASSSSGGGGKGVRGLYNPLDAMWRDQKTGGTIYVGNQQAAQNANLLKQHGITHVVNCTDTMPFYHQNAFTYHRFNVSFWPAHGGIDELQAFLAPLWEFVDGALAAVTITPALSATILGGEGGIGPNVQFAPEDHATPPTFYKSQLDPARDAYSVPDGWCACHAHSYTHRHALTPQCHVISQS